MSTRNHGCQHMTWEVQLTGFDSDSPNDTIMDEYCRQLCTIHRVAYTFEYTSNITSHGEGMTADP